MLPLSDIDANGGNVSVTGRSAENQGY